MELESQEQKGLISLKEASTISGYSSDYIGQLIREGKISGKQVYSSIQWMTTAREVLEYKNIKKQKKSGILAKFDVQKRKIAMELNIFKLFFQTFKSSLPLVLVIIISFILFSYFMLYLSFGPKTHEMSNKTTESQAVIQY
jgi:hypothetical protein